MRDLVTNNFLPENFLDPDSLVRIRSYHSVFQVLTKAKQFAFYRAQMKNPQSGQFICARCAHQRDNSRTFDPDVLQSLDKLELHKPANGNERTKRKHLP